MNANERTVKRKSYIGFSIFDIIHFLGSLALLIYLHINQPENWRLRVAECYVAIVFAVLLVSFIVEIAKKHGDPEEKKNDMSFAFLVATGALLVPDAFFASASIGEPVSASTVLFIVNLVVDVLALGFFMMSLFHVKKESWEFFFILGLVAFFVLAPVDIALALVSGGDPFIIAITVAIACAPIFPFAFCLMGLLDKLPD